MKPVRLESSIERAAVRKANLKGWSSIKVNSRYYKGYPDRLFWKNNVYVWVEFKGPKGILTPLQAVRIRRLARDGCQVAVCNSVDSCMEFLDKHG